MKRNAEDLTPEDRSKRQRTVMPLETPDVTKNSNLITDYAWIQQLIEYGEEGKQMVRNKRICSYCGTASTKTKDLVLTFSEPHVSSYKIWEYAESFVSCNFCGDSVICPSCINVHHTWHGTKPNYFIARRNWIRVKQYLTETSDRGW